MAGGSDQEKQKHSSTGGTDDNPAADQTADGAEGPRPQAVTYSMSGGLIDFLSRYDVSIAASSYQSGKFYLIGRNPHGGLMVNEHFFNDAMGISVQGNSVYLATLYQILRMENVLKAGEQVDHTFDTCFVPRSCHVTGALDAHDVGVTADGGIVFVNTRYNCLAAVSRVHSFKPVWKPSFISKIVDEDRCHLNGLAMADGRPRYVTAVSKSDTIDGWRDRRRDGGIVIDVDRNEIICEGLSMPQSPRVYRGRLWLLNSGTGELGWVELAGAAGGKFHAIAFCPGFVRGLAFHGKYALVGLSKPRYERFEGLDLDAKLLLTDSEPWCGIQIIDLDTGTCVEWFRIDGDVAELYDVAALPGVACPMSLGFVTDEILGFITHEEMEVATPDSND